MSSSENSTSQTFPFVVHAPESEIIVTVYDAYDQAVGSTAGETLVLSLGPGLYRIRSDRMGQIEDEFVRHGGATEVTAKLPPYYSPAPLEGAKSSHEYYTGPSQQYSHELTAPPLGDGNRDAHLFVFIRAASAQAFHGGEFNGELSIMDADGNTLATADETNTAFDRDAGWMAFSAKADSGFYIARYRIGEFGRDVAVFLPSQWQTQVFLTYHGIVLPQSMRIFLAHPEDGFHATDEIIRSVDVALTGLQNNDSRIPSGVMQDALQGKFDNPMLGLLAGHFLLRSERPDANLVEMVFGNLEGLIPDSPDLAALKLMAASRFGAPLGEFGIAFPPMLRAGLEALLTLSTDYPELVPEDSLLDRIATRLMADSPWSSWESLDYLDAGVLPSREGGEEVDWVQAAVLDSLEQILKKDRGYDVKDIARSLRVPARTVGKAIDALDRRTSADLRGTFMKGLESLETLLQDDERRARIRHKASSLIDRFLK